jgi:hypothetical protein
MGQSNRAAANVVDLETFRQRKLQAVDSAPRAPSAPMSAAMMVPVWVCWVPVWAPMMA